MLAIALALAGALLIPASAAARSASFYPCKDPATTVVGIAAIQGCINDGSYDKQRDVLTQVMKGPQTVDMNGFLVRLGEGERLTFSPDTREVTTHGRKVQLLSEGYPTSGLSPLGDPHEISFRAPKSGSMLLEDLRFGQSSGVFKAFAGLLPIGTVDTPIKLHEGGKGSMDLTVALTGIFTLKGKDQSVTIKVPTEVGKGAKLDGFDLKLKEIDAFKAFTIHGLSAEYSARDNVIAGDATVSFPFSKGKGFGVGLKLENGTLRELRARVAGLKIPIASAGTLTSIEGGFRTNTDRCGAFPDIMARLGATLGPDIPTPFGDLEAVSVDAGFELGRVNGLVPALPPDAICAAQLMFFKVDGGVEVFRLPVGSAEVKVYTDGAVKFFAKLGIGLPSFKNEPDDTFYVGGGVHGWIAQQKFQFTGDVRTRLGGVDILDAKLLVNHRALGGCWKVIGLPGGAVYEYGKREVKTFGVACGLDEYEEQFPHDATASQSRPRRIRLDGGQVALQAKGKGGPPRFTIRGPNGRVYSSPHSGERPAEKSRGHFFFVNETGTNTTHLLIRKPRGVWTVTPHRGSPTITSLKAGSRQPRERVKAEVRGVGAYRELVWRSRGRRNTKLIFSEIAPGGVEIPILRTDREDGRHVFRVNDDVDIGRRELRVRVEHGYGVTQEADVDRYTVNDPPLLREPKRIKARRYAHNVHVRWTGVKGAQGYLVEVDEPGARHRVGLVRVVSPRARRVVFRNTPGGGRLIARVHTINSDGKPGPAEVHRFATGPSADNLREAARHSLRSVRLGKRFVRAVTHCPQHEGHCEVKIELRSRRGRRVGRVHFHQTPDTFHLHHIRPRSRRVRRLMRRGRNPHLRVVITIGDAADFHPGEAARVRASKEL